ncbi:MAG: hypothetical protein P8Z00_23755 [Anaerolineales bacterium]
MIKHSTILILFAIFLSACQPRTIQTVAPTGTPQPATPTSTPTAVPIPTQTPLPSITAPAFTSTPETPTQPITGIHINHLTSPDEMSLFTQAGAYWTRFDGFHWDLIEPVDETKPVYQWKKVNEAALKAAANAGAQVIAIVNYAPDWAQKYPGVACGPFAEAALDKFGAFMYALVSRYSQPPYNVKYWEIGNEPDIDHTLIGPHSPFGCWGDQSDPYYGGGYYARMLKAAYGQVKQADPQSQVLIGGLLLDCDPNNPPETSKNSGKYKDCSPSRFLEGILKNGGGDYFDGVSFHAYDYFPTQLGQYVNPNWHSSWDTTGPVLTTKATFIHDLLAANGHSDKFLIDTEFALLCGKDGTEAKCQTEEFNLTKAYYIAEGNAAAVAHGLLGNVWYSLTGWRASGLVDKSLKPNLAYDAEKFSAAQLKDAAFVADVTAFPGVKGYEFHQKDGKKLWLLWSQDGDSHSIQLTSLPTGIFDAFGKALPTEKNLTISVAPVYLEWEP